MATTDPIGTVDPRFGEEGAGPTPWPDVRAALTEAELSRYDHDLETFQRADGYGIHARIAAVLHGLYFCEWASRCFAGLIPY